MRQAAQKEQQNQEAKRQQRQRLMYAPSSTAHLPAGVELEQVTSAAELWAAAAAQLRAAVQQGIETFLGLHN